MNLGFFAKTGPTTQKNNAVTGCAACGLDKKCSTPRMGVTGEGRKGVLLIAEASGATEDEKGKQLVGTVGQWFRDKLEELDVDLDRDFWKINACGCRPTEAGKRGPKNRAPTDLEIQCCQPRVWAAIKEKQPSLIILAGGAAIKSFLMGRYHDDNGIGGVMRWRGWQIPDRDVNAWVCPIFHPSYVTRSSSEPVVETIFDKDLKQAIRMAGRRLPADVMTIEDPDTMILSEEAAAAHLRDMCLDKTPFSCTDYEATGLKPHAKAQHMVCAAITHASGTIAFPITPKTKPYLKRYMNDAKMKKAAHNESFEHMWAMEELDADPQGWDWCSMNAAHVLDNREQITGLKFQIYVNFGLVDYDSHISSYLKGVEDKNANALNRIHELNIHDVMKYCSIDTRGGYHLALRQKQQIRARGLQDAYDLVHAGLPVMARMQQNGMCVDIDYCRQAERALKMQIKKTRQRIYSSEEGKIWLGTYGKRFNLESNPQLADVLFNHMGYESTKETDGGGKSVGEEALEALDSPFVDDVKKLRTLNKTLNTYLKGLLRETVDGIMHPFFPLNTTVSFRGSSRNPNFQNMPVRDKEQGRMIRRAIKPRPGRQLLEVDYGGIEVKSAACVTKDPKLIEYETDPDTDMHRDMAMQIFKLPQAQVTKDSRYYAKSSFVFAQFYGDYHIPCATSLWKNIKQFDLSTADGVGLYEHLANNGIKSYGVFENHLKQVEKDFWKRRFSVYDQWKKDFLREYNKRGYIDTVTGFRCGGVMPKNVLHNLPIQGPAFHCLLWSLIRMDEIARQEGWASLLVGQIHDSIIMDVVPEEVLHILATAERVMCHEVREHWPWLIVPLVIEAEITPIDMAWHYKEEVKI